MLGNIQQEFLRAIVKGDDSAILAKIQGGRIGSAARLRIYRNNVYEGFRTTLAAAFPVIERLVGQGCFRGLALDYFRTCPSHSGDLATYGYQFADSLAKRYENSAFDYLADVARLEWAYQEVMMAADAKALQAQEISGVQGKQIERLRLHLHPAVGLVASPYPILSIWRSNREEPEHQTGVNIHSGGESIVLVRTSDAVELQLVEPAELTLLKACAAGRLLTEASQQAQVIAPEFDLQRALARAFTLGLFSTYSLSQS